MSDWITEVKSEEEFRAAIESGTVLIDFFATWCPPCRAQLPILEELAEKMAEKVKVVKVDTDALGGVAGEYQVSNIPTMVLLRDGKIIDRFVGLQQEATLRAAIEK
ncbi:MAG TPA: thioredoxin [Planctomycetaceae bacterium]|nr:thioredoxin [Planctomycetaceae bacterium]